MNRHSASGLSVDGPLGLGRYEPPGTAWLGRRFKAVGASGMLDADANRTPTVCPFCGRSYEEPRQRCDACGGVPVVAPDNCRVYSEILALCGPDCERVAVRRATDSP